MRVCLDPGMTRNLLINSLMLNLKLYIQQGINEDMVLRNHVFCSTAYKSVAHLLTKFDL